MLAVPPQLLGLLARAMGSSAVRPQAALVLAGLTRSQAPVIAVEQLAERRPSAVSDASPFVVTCPEEEPVRGPLEGERVVVKDSLDVSGARTGLGLRDGGEVSLRDATIVARVREAGGRVFAKTKMTELGMDGLGALMPYRTPRNPAAPGYFPGGSSTGTAVAIASSMARYGLGGDGLGSVRIPAAYCGLVGLKPTHDRLPIDGYHSPAHSMDVPGPITRDVSDCARLWQVLAGERVQSLDASRPARVGVIRELGPELASRSMRRAFERVIERLRVRIETVDVPGARESAYFGAVYAAHELGRSALAERELSAAGRLILAMGRALDASHVADMGARRARMREGILRAVDRMGLIAMPTTAVPPPALSSALLAGGQDALLMRAVGTYTPIANLTGLPAIVVPCGRDERGRPLSIMFMGPPGSETALLQTALAVEELGLGTTPIGAGR